MYQDLPAFTAATTHKDWVFLSEEDEEEMWPTGRIFAHLDEQMYVSLSMVSFVDELILGIGPAIPRICP
jgi:hypothetical protein